MTIDGDQGIARSGPVRADPSRETHQVEAGNKDRSGVNVFIEKGSPKLLLSFFNEK